MSENRKIHQVAVPRPRPPVRVVVRISARSTPFPVRVPARSTPVVVRDPAPPTPFPVRVSARSTPFPLRVPARSTPFPVRVPARSTPFPVRVPASPTPFPVRVPARSTPFPVRDPARSGTPLVGPALSRLTLTFVLRRGVDRNTTSFVLRHGVDDVALVKAEYFGVPPSAIRFGVPPSAAIRGLQTTVRVPSRVRVPRSGADPDRSFLSRLEELPPTDVVLRRGAVAEDSLGTDAAGATVEEEDVFTDSVVRVAVVVRVVVRVDVFTDPDPVRVAVVEGGVFTDPVRVAEGGVFTDPVRVAVEGDVFTDPVRVAVVVRVVEVPTRSLTPARTPFLSRLSPADVLRVAEDLLGAAATSPGREDVFADSVRVAVVARLRVAVRTSSSPSARRVVVVRVVVVVPTGSTPARTAFLSRREEPTDVLLHRRFAEEDLGAAAAGAPELDVFTETDFDLDFPLTGDFDLTPPPRPLLFPVPSKFHTGSAFRHPGPRQRRIAGTAPAVFSHTMQRQMINKQHTTVATNKTPQLTYLVVLRKTLP